MSAARRSSGSGTLTALVVFIVLAFIGIGAALWLYQQKAILQEAILKNQSAFEGEVGQIFRDNRWDLTAKTGAEYGLEYDTSAFREVADKLKLAAELEKMRPTLGWDTAAAVEKALSDSPVQQGRTDRYGALSSLLAFYENQYDQLTKRVETLEGEVGAKEQQLADKTQLMNELQNKLLGEKNEAIAQYRTDVERREEQYRLLNQRLEEARKDLENTRGELKKAEEEWKARLAEVEQEAKTWERLYKQTLKGEDTEETMKAAGKVLAIEPAHEFVMIEGGSDVGRDALARYVVYVQNPSGARTKKGEIMISAIHGKTSRATVLQQSEQILAGDLFVREDIWKKFQEPKQVAEIPKTPVLTPTITDETEPKTIEATETTTEETAEETGEETTTTTEEPSDTTETFEGWDEEGGGFEF